MQVEGVAMLLGEWWVEAAKRGGPALFPVVNRRGSNAHHITCYLFTPLSRPGRPRSRRPSWRLAAAALDPFSSPVKTNKIHMQKVSSIMRKCTLMMVISEFCLVYRVVKNDQQKVFISSV